MASIRVTPETLSSQGSDLVTYAGDLKDILDMIDTKINEIVDGWDGLAQDAYFDMYGQMKESLKQFPELVDSLGQATISAAEAFASVDEQLQAGFKGQ